MSCSSSLQPKGAAPAFASLSIWLSSLGSWSTAELCRQAGSHRDLSLPLFPCVLQLCSFGWAYPAPGMTEKKTPKGCGCRGLLPWHRGAGAPLHQLELWLSWRNSHSSLLPMSRRGRMGLTLEPRNASVTASSYSRDGPRGSWEDPEPGKLSSPLGTGTGRCRRRAGAGSGCPQQLLEGSRCWELTPGLGGSAPTAVSTEQLSVPSRGTGNVQRIPLKNNHTNRFG